MFLICRWRHYGRQLLDVHRHSAAAATKRDGKEASRQKVGAATSPERVPEDRARVPADEGRSELAFAAKELGQAADDEVERGAAESGKGYR